MLQTATVKESTYNLLKELMADSVFSKFSLVGGTSIALRMGYRKSIDLDLFTQDDFDVAEINDYLVKRYGFIERFRSGKTLKGDIKGVFVDFIKYPYPLVKPIEKNEDIRLFSLEDVSAMKLSAITDNGSRLKDFVDVAYLSFKFSLNEMLRFYEEKFCDSNILSVLKSLGYYGDIDFEGEPIELLSGNFSWEKVKNRIDSMISNPDKRFKDFPI